MKPPPFKLPDQTRQRLGILFANIKMSVHITGSIQTGNAGIADAYLLNSKLPPEHLALFMACSPDFQAVLNAYVEAAVIQPGRGWLMMIRVRVSPEGVVDGFRVTPRDELPVEPFPSYSWKTGHLMHPYEN